jgi:6-pyruvoyl-tetrahydropterin synthase
MYTLSKKFRFEAAHRLAKDYVGKCASLHGHSWNGEIIIEYSGKLDKYDMSLDYRVLGEWCKKVEEFLDHACLIYEGDKDLLNLCVTNGWRFAHYKDNPTCEVIARDLHKHAMKWFESFGIDKIKILIHETCTTGCLYSE